MPDIIFQERSKIGNVFWKKNNTIFCILFIILFIALVFILLYHFENLLTMKYSAIVLAFYIIVLILILSMIYMLFQLAFLRQEFSITTDGIYPPIKPNIAFKGMYLIPWDTMKFIFLIEEEYLTKMMELGFIYQDSNQLDKYKLISLLLTEREKIHLGKYRRVSFSLDPEESKNLLDFVKIKYTDSLLIFPTNTDYFKFLKENNISIISSVGGVSVVESPLVPT